MKPDGSEQTRLTNGTDDSVDPCISPDGARIAFSRRVNGQFDIFLTTPDNKTEQNLTATPGDDRHPCFSADGKYITFQSNRDGAWNIYLMNADGSTQTALDHRQRR